jgi:hypothetical protein
MEKCPLCGKPIGNWLNPHLCTVAPPVKLPEEVKPMEDKQIQELVNPQVFEKPGLLQQVIITLTAWTKKKPKAQ